jgi:GTP cyclohydrolase II
MITSTLQRPIQRTIQRTVSARLPTAEGHFQLIHYRNNQDDKEHLALVMGDVQHQAQVLVRVHSECFTGDVLGSQRCDCGEQLHTSMQLIATEGRGVIIYLRQEGRGIGLQKKLQAYNLQDQGYDTVDANLLLGHQADERTYWAAEGILRDLEIRSLRLLTNNPDKIDQLREYALEITDRVPLEPTINGENVAYLTTKVARMRHMLHLPTNGSSPTPNGVALPLMATQVVADLQAQAATFYAKQHLPFVTLSYAQSIDGSIATTNGLPLAISGEASLTFTHTLRAAHDAILVGIETVLSDNPRLTVRLAPGIDPQPVVLDSQLRIPPEARCLQGSRPAWIATTNVNFARQQPLEASGARILPIAPDPQGRVDLVTQGIRSIMVEGGARVLGSFVQARLANWAVVTIAPIFVGGLRTMPNLLTTPTPLSDAEINPTAALPRLTQPHFFQLGDDMILSGQFLYP